MFALCAFCSALFASSPLRRDSFGVIGCDLFPFNCCNTDFTSQNALQKLEEGIPGAAALADTQQRCSICKLPS